MPLRNLVVVFAAAMLSLACYQRASRNRYVSTLTEAMNVITTQYVDEVEPRKLFDGAMDGMVKQLDPNSGYTSPEEYEHFKESLDQEFGGVGIMVEVNAETNRLTVMSPLIGTPAYKAGMKAGDVIMAIDGQDTQKLTLKDAVDLMRGPEGSKVKVTVVHSGDTELVDFELERAVIPIESVLGDIRKSDGSWVFTLEEEPHIGYIRLVNFGERTRDELLAALHTLTRPELKIEGLILDLRGNAGGLLKAAVETCDMFLDEGQIVSTRGRGKVMKSSASAVKGIELPRDVPLAIIIDKYSASASEIVAACLQDHHRASIVGQRSWGKGTVQNIIQLEGGRSALRLTVASYWRPSGVDIHKRKGALDTDDWGVRPDPGLEVNLTDDQAEQVFRARRARDTSIQGREPPARKPPAEIKRPELTVEPPVPVPQPEGTDEPSSSTTAEDPQLKKAIEHLQEQLDRRASEPRQA